MLLNLERQIFVSPPRRHPSSAAVIAHLGRTADVWRLADNEQQFFVRQRVAAAAAFKEEPCGVFALQKKKKTQQCLL